MKSTRLMKTWLIRALLLVLLLDTTGCSWWRHRREARAAHDEAVATAPAAGAAAADATPAPDAAAGVDAPAGPAPLSTADVLGAQRLAGDFYEMHARFAGRGLLDASATNAYGAFLCPSLVRALDDARARQTEFRTAHPGDKPPLADGDLFSSLFEGVEQATPGIPVAEGETVRVPVTLARGVGPGAQHWQDALILQKDQGVWCVADVDYGGTWPMANTGRLTDTLKSAFE